MMSFSDRVWPVSGWVQSFSAKSWSLAALKPVAPLTIGMMSFSDRVWPVSGWVQSFFIIFSTHSTVTTCPVVLRTAQGVELYRVSDVTAHWYLSSLEIILFLLSGSFTSVHCTSARSFTLSGLPDMGQ